MAERFRVGVIGMGNVGGALVRRLTEDADQIAEAAGRPIVLEAIAVAHRGRRQAPAEFVTAEELLGRKVDAVVELIGGIEPAHTYINKALTAGRQVITANKQVIAAHGPSLARLGPLRFEASVASAIPIVELLAETFAAERIRSISGILNGTTNSMLETMAAGASYEDALADAQRRGLAEADPSADVDGHDPAAKLAILAMLAFRLWLDVSQIERTGIRGLDQTRLAESRNRGCVVKLIAAATLNEMGRIDADVRPRLIPRDLPMAQVNGPMNAIELDAAKGGPLLLTGLGAGPDAAASAVLADLVRAARGTPASAGRLLAGLADKPVVAVRSLGPMAPYPAAS
ncbi:MAG TPA: homoserine dehydrogenase [Candidatus Dormibacteraeota bacterium]|nr:homoserine dehydrogenase [Candidatus Dormibacteraeota bacterium]